VSRAAVVVPVETAAGGVPCPFTKEDRMDEELVVAAADAPETEAPALDDFSVVEVDEVPAALIQLSPAFCA